MASFLTNWKTSAGGVLLIVLFIAKTLGVSVAGVDLSHLDMSAIVALVGGWIGINAQDITPAPK